MEDDEFFYESEYRRDNLPREYFSHVARLSEGLDVHADVQFCPQNGRSGFGDGIVSIKSNCPAAFSEMLIRLRRIEGIYENLSLN